MDTIWNYGSLQEGFQGNSLEGVREIVPDFQVDTWVQELTQGVNPIAPDRLMGRISELFFGQIRSQAALLVGVLALAFLSALVSQMSASFSSKGMQKSASFFLLASLATLVSGGLAQAVMLGKEAIDSMTFFMQYDAVAVCYLSVSSGTATSATAMHGILTMAVGGMATLMQSMVLPLICASAALGIIHHASGSVQFIGLSKLCSGSAKWLMGIFSAIFMALVTLTGLGVSAFDGVGGKAAKFAVGSMVPVVGGTLSEAMETVAGSALLMKNAVGTAGMLILLCMVLSPLIRMGVLVLLYRIAAAFTEAMGDKRCADILSVAATTLTLLFAAVALMSLFLMISLGAILVAGNLAYAMR